MAKIIQCTISAEDYEQLTETEARYNALKTLIERNKPVFITVTMIANALGISRQDVLNRPWHLPNFGKTETVGEKRKMRFWHFEEYLDWVVIPEYERIMLYRKMCNDADIE